MKEHREREIKKGMSKNINKTDDPKNDDYYPHFVYEKEKDKIYVCLDDLYGYYTENQFRNIIVNLLKEYDDFYHRYWKELTKPIK